MSIYTTQVRFICETLAGFDQSQGYGKVKDIIEASWDKIFDFNFPIFDEEYRSVLCKKILMHYYTREIGFETVGLWKLKLETKMNEIMPYYNQMYESTKLKFDAFRDADYTKDHSGNNEGRSNTDVDNDRTTSDSHNVNRSRNDSGQSYNLFSDTPQGALVGVNSETYLTDARKITSNDNSSGNENGTAQGVEHIDGNTSHNYSNTDEYIEHVYGKYPGKSYSALLKEFRETFVNVDMQVIDELNKLFMLLWR